MKLIASIWKTIVIIFLLWIAVWLILNIGKVLIFLFSIVMFIVFAIILLLPVLSALLFLYK